MHLLDLQCWPRMYDKYMGTLSGPDTFQSFMRMIALYISSNEDDRHFQWHIGYCGVSKCKSTGLLKWSLRRFSKRNLQRFCITLELVMILEPSESFSTQTVDLVKRVISFMSATKRHISDWYAKHWIYADLCRHQLYWAAWISESFRSFVCIFVSAVSMSGVQM